MNKITKIFLLSLFSVIIFSSGIFLGYYAGLLRSYENRVELSKRQEAFQTRTESYQPSCNELQEVASFKVVENGNDRFIIDTSENYFVVFGFNAEPGKAPMTAWWGASRIDALKQACEN